jgi:hypothetical protein
VVVRGTEERKTEKKKLRRRSGSRSRWREDVDLVHTTRPEEDEGRRHPPPEVLAKWTVRHRVGADDAGEQRGSHRGRRAASLDTTPQHHRQSLTGVGGEASEKKEGRATYKGGGFHRRWKCVRRFHRSRASPREPPATAPESPARTSTRPSPRKMEGEVISLETCREE